MSSSVLSVERVVVLLTPLFAALAAWVVAVVANNVPGSPKLDSTDLTALMISGVLGAVSLVLKWLHGRQKPQLLSTGRPLPTSVASTGPAEVSPVSQ
jgi:hypothetical protein